MTTNQIAGSIANRMIEFVNWLDSAPDWLKPERIQDELVHRPRSLGDAASFIGRWSDAFEIVGALRAFLEQLAGNAADGSGDANAG
jgi:hypothetical protein